MAEKVIIRHKDGRQYATSVGDWRKHYESDGFKVVSYESGKAFEDRKAASSTTAEPKTEGPTT